MKYSIIIPTYNHCDDLLKPCIESIIANTDLTEVEVIIVANGCTDNTRAYIAGLEYSFKLIWFDNPIGYTKAIIEGINHSSGEYIILLNNDCVILDYMSKSEWIDILEEPFKTDDKVGLTGPSKIRCQYTQEDFIIFFCVMIPRKIINEVGLPNIVFNPGYGEDIDYSIRVKKAGYKLIQVPSTFPLWHQAEKTVHAPLDWKKHFGVDSWDDVVERNIEILCKVHPVESSVEKKPIRLNLGCGDERLDGYISCDLYAEGADMRIDAISIPYDNNTVDEIRAYHLIEHFTFQGAFKALREWHRVLKPGGVLVMETPDFYYSCKAFVETGDLGLYGHFFANPDSSAGQVHYFLYTEEQMRWTLSETGFVNVRRENPDSGYAKENPHRPLTFLKVVAYKPVI